MSDDATSRHRQERRRWLAAAPALAVVGTGIALPQRSNALDAAATDTMLKARLADQGVGFVALQIDGGRVEIAAQGRAQGDVPLRADALFEIGSITKTFTALLLADAVLRKRFALEDPVEHALPGVTLRDVADAPIRWIDLATHRSGLPRLPTNMAPRDEADPYADYDESRLLDFLRNFKPTLARDAHWEYSNLGFGLLGYALGRAENTAYPKLLQERVLGPLAMTRTALSLPGRSVDGLVEGHDATGKAVPHWHLDVLMGAGALVMPASDLAIYARAALTHASSPLGPAFELAQRQHAAGPTPINPIGLAWIRAPLNGRTVLTHDGGTYGFSSSLWLDPQRQRASAVLANAMVEVNDLALHLLDDSVPTKDMGLMRQATVTVDPAQLAPLAGVYAMNPQFKLTVTVRDGELWAQATGQGPFQLFPKSPRRFFAKVTPLEIEFAAGPSPASLQIVQGGQTLQFTRE